MILGIVAILLVGVIAYFHWVQGLFTGTISAAIAAIAAVLAVSYHEPLAAALLQGKFSDQAYAITLIALFALIYLIGRVIFDNFVPGNIRLPAMVDKVGGGVMGFIAGMFAIGILILAAQTLPFGAAVAGYARYTLKDSREVQLPQSRGQAVDIMVNDELKNDDVDPNKADEGLLLPVDDFVIGMVNQLSDGGSLEGDRPFKSIHPAYINELFFQRAGVQVGAKHVALNTAKLKGAEFVKAFAVDSLDQAEGEMKEIRPPRKEVAKPLTSTPVKQVVVIRIKFEDDATDDDHMVRVGTASVRLVAGGKNYIPVGTLNNGLLLANKPDDFLVAKPGESVDFVFNVERDALKRAGGGDEKKPAYKFAKGALVEVKRMIRFDLGDATLDTEHDDSANGLLRKKTVVDDAANKPRAEAPAPAPAKDKAPAKSIGGIAEGVGGVRAAEAEAAGDGKKKGE